MRGSDGYNESLFSTVRLEDFVPANHPLRPIRNCREDVEVLQQPANPQSGTLVAKQVAICISLIGSAAPPQRL
jgi:hypothetical protein